MANVNTTKKNHILIIDDNAILLRTVKEMLNEEYTVSIATSSSQAFMAIAKKKPDIILLDYEMPIVDGEATLRMLRDDENTRDIPVIFLTGAADSEVVTKLLTLKPSGYILKPPNKQKMIELIKNTLADCAK